MTRQIRLIGAALMVCFTVLFVQLTRLTVIEAGSLNDNPNNTREILRDFNQPRGTISTADGVVIARSVPSPPEDRFELQREYPEGPLFAHLTGFFSFTLGSAGVEKVYNDELAGRTNELSLKSLEDLFVDEDRVGNVTLTVRADLQRIAAETLGDRRGSVVALDPRTGAILAMYSNPTYDPNVLANHDTAAATQAQEALDAQPDKPRLARTYQERFFPGSTFKVVTATAGLASGKVTPDSPSYPTQGSYTPPLTNRPIRNFDGDSCGGTLFTILRVSCNSAFAQMGVEVGAEDMVEAAEGYGFNDAVPIDLTAPARSAFPGVDHFERNDPALAQSAIGQNEVAATPLQMALVAAAVANGGEIMAPHVLQDVRDTDQSVVDEHDDDVWRTAMDPGTAETLRQAMLGVVESGTATRLKVPGYEVGGKTGTAQLGTDPPRSHAWIIGFGGRPGERASVVVAVIVEGAREVSNQTGGRVAAPIAQAVLKAALDAGRDDG